ncbi:hypothetical protein DFP72DRAFT_1166382 [Ephemerocybe angulata]|uniref:Uncharacterized protein n=1 Tax=Ephemerocybe angulata TaxID=980116 RepID=A0A8H6I724_9AGAR|nr:hypothetical protein DFP72DRAFT_1166382 [Tulosesus angulatus]
MYPLALLPVVGDDLEKMDSRTALRYQNTFMKNALIRGLNNVYEYAGSIVDGNHKSFKEFMGYNQVVREMMQLHIDGDNLFFTTPGPNKITIDRILGGAWTSNPHRIKLKDQLNSWDKRVESWSKKPDTYRGSELRSLLDGMQDLVVKGLIELIHSVKPELLAKNFSAEEMQAMIDDNIVWLATKGNVLLLLPFCTSHHDRSTSKFWPSIAPEGLKAIPDMTKENSSVWSLAPFHPVKFTKNPKV